MASRAFLLLVLIVVAFPSSTISRAVPDHCSRTEGITLIRPIDIPHNFRFPKATELVIEQVIVGEWDGPMFARLNKTKHLTINDAITPIITYQSSELESLTVLHSQLSLFDVWPERNQILRTLRLNRNKLKVVPKNLPYLENLTSLDLSQNELKWVNLQELEGMNKLKHLDLSVNQITRIDAPAALRLNRLKNLEVSFNLLERFDAFPQSFPVLRTIRLIGNKWTCEWVDLARKNIIERGITAFGVDYGCSEHRQGGLCCYGELTPVNVDESGLLKEGSLLQQVQGLVKDLAENPIKAHSGQSALELLTRDEEGVDDKILVGVKLNRVKVFF